MRTAACVYTDTHTQTHTHTDRHTHRHTDTQTHRHTDTKTHRHTDTHTQKVLTWSVEEDTCKFLHGELPVVVFIPEVKCT
jgi:hypothetical protein